MARRELPADLKVAGKTEAVQADLADPNTLPAAIEGVDTIVHFAGVLFKANPKRFLPMTNTVFLRLACQQWGAPAPWPMPLWVIYSAAALCEFYSSLSGSISPLTRDFIDIGRVSYYGDTTRFRKELLPTLRYPTFLEGVCTL